MDWQLLKLKNTYSRELIFFAITLFIFILGNFIEEPSGYYGAIKTILISIIGISGVIILRGKARDLCLLTTSIALPLSLVVFYLIFFSSSSKIIHENSSWGASELGYSPLRPGTEREIKFNEKGEKIYDVSYTITERLIRKVDSNPEGETIPFFGCSFAFGIGLNDEATLPQVFSNLTNQQYQVLNLGIPGGGPQQMLRILETNKYSDLLSQKPKFFVLETSPFHIARAACKSSTSWFGPKYKIEDNDIKYLGTCAGESGVLENFKSIILNRSILRHLFGTRDYPVDQADLSLYVGIVKKSAKIIKEKYGVPLVVLFIPDNINSNAYNFNQQMYSKATTDMLLLDPNIIWIDASFDRNFAKSRLSDLIINGDGHPTKLSNQIWAKKIYDRMIVNNLSSK